MLIRVLLLLLCCALTAPTLPAQSIDIFPLPEAQRTLARFSLAPAGARALGLAGAFVAVADDVTAADANPAGLAQLDRPQLLVSSRWSSFDNEIAGGLALPGETTSESVAGPAFLGYAHPLGKLTLAGYYQQDAPFESETPRFQDRLILVDSPFIFDHRRYEQKVESFAFAAGARVGSAVSVGAALRYQRLSLDWQDDLDFLAQEPVDLPPVIGTLFQEIDDRDADLTVALGLLFHPRGRWTGGLAYQQGGDFGLTGIYALSFGFPVPVENQDVRLSLPDVISAGASFRPQERWLLSAQLSRLTYSDLAGEPVSFIAGGTVAGGTVIRLFGADEPIDDATQIHLGAEVRLGSDKRPITLRAGAWSDPDHDGIRSIDSDQIHGTLGAGAVLGGRWDLNGAVSWSDTVVDGILALSYRL